jgi:hypothetical protein
MSALNDFPYARYTATRATIEDLANILAPNPDGPLVPTHASIRLTAPSGGPGVTVVGSFVTVGTVGQEVGFIFALEDGQEIEVLRTDFEWLPRR